MKVPRFKIVLFCLPLRKGCILMVYLNLIVACIAVITFGLLDFIKMFVRLFVSNSYELAHRAFRSKVHSYILLPLFMAYTLSELAMFVVGLIGLHKKRLNLIKVMLYFNVLVTSFMFFFRMFDVNHYYWVMEILAAIVYLTFKTYFILLLRSLVKKMLEREAEDSDSLPEELELGMPTQDSSK